MLLRDRDIPVYAICDDGRAGQTLDGFPITNIESVDPSKDLTIFVTSGFNEPMIQKLKRLGLDEWYVEADFGRFEPEKETYQFFAEHGKEVEDAYLHLNDAISRKVFLNLINYRISRDLKYMTGIRENTAQYFPDVPNLRKVLPVGLDSHIFMDLGAYDGDSVRGFLSYVDGKYKKIFAVEASQKNFSKLVENTTKLKDIECLNVGIADARGTISFSMSDAKNSFASEAGEDIISVDSVDNILNGREVSFIKMDIEGAEYNAIKGARKSIEKYTPILAVSVYHLTEDLFRILLEIEEIAKGRYDYYMRHYSPTMIETILYAIPKY